MKKMQRLLFSTVIAAVTIGLSALPAHAGWSNHNETLLPRR